LQVILVQIGKAMIGHIQTNKHRFITIYKERNLCVVNLEIKLSSPRHAEVKKGVFYTNPNFLIPLSDLMAQTSDISN